jgi:signal transduction histidine kinase
MLIRQTPWGDMATGLVAQSPGRFAARDRRLAFWIALWLAAVAAEFGALIPVLFGTGTPVEGLDVLFRVTGGSFVACGLIAWRRRPDSRAGMLMTATGFSLFIVPVASQVDAPLAQTFSWLFSDLWTISFVALLLTFVTGGRLRSHTDRTLIGAFVLSLVVLQVPWMLFWQQDGNLLAAFPDAGVENVIDKIQRSLLAVASLATAIVIGRRWHAASSTRRRALLPVVAGVVCLLLFTGMLTNDLVTGTRPEWLIWIVLGSIVLVPAGFLAGLLRSRLARGGLADLFRGLATVRGEELQEALGRAIGDPSLLVAYRLPGSLGYADADGQPVMVPPVARDRACAAIAWDGQPIAALVYDASLDDDPELVEAVCAAGAIALENERLHGESRLRLAELQASRERIVAAGDAERRRLERNLHDGAQQRLVAIALQLRLLQDNIRDDPAAAERLAETASDEVGQSLTELRDLARGLHPAVLDYGLASALDALALRSTVPTEVSMDTADRFPQPVELAAYFVACEALANVGKYAKASMAHVRVWRRGPLACVEIADDGIGGADVTGGSGLQGLTDRVEALEGRLRISSPAGAGTVVTAELPCGS